MNSMSTTNSGKIVTVIGGSGFVGRHLVRSLARRGYRIRVGCRRPDLAGHVLPLGTPGQIVPVQVNVRFPDSIATACKGATSVIDLAAVLYNSGGQTFEALHEFGAEASARAAKAAGASLYIQMSGLGAEADAPSAFLRSRATGERLARTAFPGTIVVRPSVIFGPEDQFFNRLADMARFSPILPMVGEGKTVLQPVFVGDVAEAIATLVDRGEANGKTYELGGPDRMSMRAVFEFVLATVKRKRLLVPLPWLASKVMAAVTGLAPKPPLTLDQLESLKVDSVVSAEATTQGATLQGLGITPRSVASIVPSYLYRFRKAGQFTVASGQPE